MDGRAQHMTTQYYTQPVAGPPGHVQPVTTQYYTQPVAGPSYVIQQSTMVVGASNPASQYKFIFRKVGANEIVMGVFCLLLGITSLVLYPFANSATGVWGGIWFIVSGSLALASAAQPNSCNVIAGLVISIIASLMAFSGLIVEAVAASSNIYYVFSGTVYGYDYDYYGRNSVAYSYELYAALHGGVAFFCFVEFVLSIVHAVFCCKSGFGRQPQGEVAAMAVPTVQVPHPTVVAQPPQYHQQNHAFGNDKI